MLEQDKIFAMSISTLSNFVLIIIKLIVGSLGNSLLLISEALHSGIDLLATIITWYAILTSSKPPDKQYPYGYGKFENLSGSIEAILIFLATGWIIYEGTHKLFNHDLPQQPHLLIVIVMTMSCLINLITSNYLMKVGKITDSIAINANAWHLRADIYTALGIILALVIMWIGEKFWPGSNLYWIDPIVSILMALLIIYRALDLIKKAFLDLMDVTLPEPEIKWLKDYLDSLKPTIHGFLNLRTRKAGSLRFIEVQVVIDGQMTVINSYALIKKIGNKIRSHFKKSNITVNVIPFNVEFFEEGGIH